ncbi:OBAP family protein [Herbaspirillum seropedicae]|uniref:Lipoprotein n=1 Tax=Herbaspirillum seropedicae (strain SmR1) TaxID=757424 RepID=D8IY44_HERSS|nr:OBAP family protein [Herbaspirillum seropedicae]ADJ66166.1 lipoprotein [Herbaspirillum seropedicae SmR1]
MALEGRRRSPDPGAADLGAVLVMTRLAPCLLMAAGVLLSACERSGDTRSAVSAPGAAESGKTRLLEAGADALQDKWPVAAINTYLDGFHFYSDRQDAQMEAHHYCSILNEELIQCLIFDGNGRDAKMMGIEYIISARLFDALPAQEKPLWHSHAYEVKSGQLVAPGVPQPAEKALMKKLVGSYGKTWHTWHTDLDKTLPLGVPQLMMGFTADGQAQAAMVEERNRRMRIDAEAKRLDRADIAAPAPSPQANGWLHGKAWQITDPTGNAHAHRQDDDYSRASEPDRNARSSR